MGIMLWTAAHKTVVISALSQEQGGLVTENQAERSHEMQLAMAEDRKAEREICIPLETGTKAENVVVENHYMERELWIYVQNGRKSFTGNISLPEISAWWETASVKHRTRAYCLDCP